jgi:FkbM family methyltransferase
MDLISTVGTIGRWARRHGVAPLLYRVRTGADAMAQHLLYPALKANTPQGLQIRGYLRHRGFLAQLQRGQYEQFTTQILDSILGQDVAFVDIGAHIGYFTVFAASRAAEVRAYEPDPYNYRALLYNCGHAIDVRHTGGVSTFMRAVAHREGPIQFHTCDTTIGNSIVERPDIGRLRRISVSAVTLDVELKLISTRKCVIKIDVEGAEELVLRGGAGRLSAMDDVVLIAESNPSALRAAGSSPYQLVAELQRLGFNVKFISEDTHKFLDVATFLEQKKGNLLAYRERKSWPNALDL